MLTQFRHIQKGTLIVVTAIIVVAFAFLYSDFDFVKGTVGKQDCLVKVYDRCYREKEVRKLSSFYTVSQQLGLGEFSSILFNENREDDDVTEFILSLVILRKEAEKMGIEPSAEEIKAAIPKLPIFQQPWVNASIVENNILGPNGFTDGDLAQLVKDYLSFQQLRDLIGAGVVAIPDESELRYTRAFQRISASVVRFEKADFLDEKAVTDEQIAEYYEANQDKFNSEPRRGFDFVKFTPPAVSEEASSEEVAKANLDFANAVNRVYADLAEEGADFKAVAAKYEEEQSDLEISFESLAPFGPSKPPGQIEGMPVTFADLFSASMQTGDVSVPFGSGEQGYYVFSLTEEILPQPMELEEASEFARAIVAQNQAKKAMNDAAGAARTQIEEALKAGKSFPAAASEAGVEAVVLDEFSLIEPLTEVSGAAAIVAAAELLAENELSEVTELPEDEGLALVYVDELKLFEDPEKDSTKRRFTASTEISVKRALFVSWLNQRRLESSSARSGALRSQ